MMYHMKPLFIRAEVDNMVVNKVFVDEEAVFNLMSYSLFKKIGKPNAYVWPHNTVLSNYKGKTNHTLGVIQVELSVSTTTRLILFVVIAFNANYSFLLGHEWIHGIGGIPLTLHQSIFIWYQNSIIDNIEADQSYNMAEVNKVGNKHFDKNLAKIPPCYAVEEVYTPQKDVIIF